MSVRSVEMTKGPTAIRAVPTMLEITPQQRQNVLLDGFRTTISLEPPVWDSLQAIARFEGMSIDDLISEIDKLRDGSSRASALRVFCIGYWRNEALGNDKEPGRSLKAALATVSLVG